MTGAPHESLLAALAFIQAKLPRIEKTRTANVSSEKGSYSYDYADLAEVSAQVLPLLGDAGLSWSCKPTLVDGKLALVYRLGHVSGETDEGVYPLPQSGTPQQIGSAISYARRYTLCAVTGVAPEQDDDDGAAASQSDRRTTQRRSRPPAAPQSTSRSTQRSRPAAGAASAAPPLPGEAGYEDDTAQADKALSRERSRLNAVIGGLGLQEAKRRDDKLAAVSAIIGRRISTTKDLTEREAYDAAQALSKIYAKYRDNAEERALAIAEHIENGRKLRAAATEASQAEIPKESQ